mmetsp:Transcript_13207/g.15129  ORF Transcript_13207/g.15129 Transcript_13207/m.15129 type:complete len:307 (-) Transcript_13207:122-1042(-)
MEGRKKVVCDWGRHVDLHQDLPQVDARVEPIPKGRPLALLDVDLEDVYRSVLVAEFLDDLRKGLELARGQTFLAFEQRKVRGIARFEPILVVGGVGQVALDPVAKATRVEYVDIAVGCDGVDAALEVCVSVAPKRVDQTGLVGVGCQPVRVTDPLVAVPDGSDKPLEAAGEIRFPVVLVPTLRPPKEARHLVELGIQMVGGLGGNLLLELPFSRRYILEKTVGFMVSEGKIVAILVTFAAIPRNQTRSEICGQKPFILLLLFAAPPRLLVSGLARVNKHRLIGCWCCLNCFLGKGRKTAKTDIHDR